MSAASHAPLEALPPENAHTPGGLERRASVAFQRAAIPQTLPLVPGYRFDVVYEPGQAADQIGGDWYDVFELPDGRLVLSIGDVCGSGLEAAVVMVSARQSIRSVAYIHPDPALMLEAADSVIRSQFPERYTTAFVAVLDPVTQLMAYATAGHPRPLIRAPAGQINALYGQGVPLGVTGFAPHNCVHHRGLEPGTLLVLYTDGLTEATRDVFEGERALRAALAQLPASHAGLARNLYDAVLPEGARDDVAILTLLVENPAPVVRWRFDPAWRDAARRVRDELCEHLTRAGMNETQLFEVLTLFSEVNANLLYHAPGTAELLLEQRGDQAVLHVLDNGPGFTFARKLPHDLFSERGRGLFLIDRLSASFSVERRPGGGSHARIMFNTRTGAPKRP